ncbi:High-affinity branched-chain amino acid transport ATP-binding protein BraG [Paraburkholderia sabiae]|uniref:ABC transporter ATP-binding protein n=1 Tax=Paraburkholderia sabiae TaxID=273251 RepID=UPI001CAC521F|nr:ABC transporter ATP-binding protein [Paraburkholderia sabiae]CAG9232799.1 High-affinity branched-chain amino acid transport ATP-binding protein BraG [Paraburkholderia sabiae]
MSTATTALQISKLEAWYGESQALFGASLDVREGETVTLLGRNGAGKTTTLRSIVGLVRRRKGAVTMGQQDLLALPIHKVAKTGIGYVPEERGIFASLSVEENLRLPPQIAEGGLSIAEIFRMFPNLDERRDSPGTKLSGGEQQMLAIARVLRTGARVLLLDEPTEGLAPVIVQRIGELLRDLKSRGYTILLVEQNFRFAAKLADRFFVMENGKIIDALTAAEVKRRANALHQYLGV